MCENGSLFDECTFLFINFMAVPCVHTRILRFTSEVHRRYKLIRNGRINANYTFCTNTKRAEKNELYVHLTAMIWYSLMS